MKNSYAPVALFDKDYDDLGIKPLMYNLYPVVRAGDTLNRKLILYNDEFEDTVITVEVVVKSSETHQVVYNYTGEKTPKKKIVAEGSRTYFLPLGEHAVIPCTFQVPAMKEGFVDNFEVDLITRKKGIIKFIETKVYSIRNPEFKGITSNKVLLGEAEH